MNILLYPIIMLITFLFLVYLFKVTVARIRMKKLDFNVVDHPRYYWLLPLLSVYLISKLYQRKKEGELKNNINLKRMLFDFNETMDLITILIIVLDEKGEIDLSKINKVSYIENLRNALYDFLNSGNYSFA